MADKFLLICIIPASISNSSDGDDEFTTFLVESLSSLLCPRQFSAYGIDTRSLVITDTKAWHVYIDCVVRSVCDEN
jgi:exosome complex RNA-binding protein Rrp42 (RNase PH superfamily)